MSINEPGGDYETAGIDYSYARRSLDAPEGDNSVAANKHVTVHGGNSRPVDQGAVMEKEVRLEF